jgi:glucans biosynthesis protein C
VKHSPTVVLLIPFPATAPQITSRNKKATAQRQSWCGMSASIVTRRADLDWLRLIAFAFAHTLPRGMAWSGLKCPLASTESIGWLREGMRFLDRWRMPLVFVVSGAAIVLALGTRSPESFTFDRVQRLLLPLAFGMVFLVPPQDYVELLYRGEFSGSFLDFLGKAFRGAYPGGKMHWHHLWFLAYALVLTFALLPCFLWLRSSSGRAFHAKVAVAMVRRGLQWLMPLPLAAAMLWLAPAQDSTNGYDFVGPWYGMAYYGVLLLWGAFLFGSPELLSALNRQRVFSLGIGVASYAAFYVVYVNGEARPIIREGQLYGYTLLSAVNTMAWLFTIVGFANRYLTRAPAILFEATEAVYPFFLLHQTVMTVAVYWLLRLQVPALAAFVLAVLATFGGTSIIYFCAVRPLRFIRPLFGLKMPGVRVASRYRRAA